MIDVFFQQKTQELRDEKGSPNRNQECQDAAQSNVEGTECEVRVQRRFSRRDDRSYVDRKSSAARSTRIKKPKTRVRGRSAAESSADAD